MMMLLRLVSAQRRQQPGCLRESGRGFELVGLALSCPDP